MKEETYRKKQVVFREGDSGDCMYYIVWGSLGVYIGYGTPNEKKLAELRQGDYFGEMGLLDHERRSATIVSLDHDTVLNRISDAEFEEFLKTNPAKVMDILRRISHKLRDTTKSYLEICQAVNTSVGAEVDQVVESRMYGFGKNERLKSAYEDVRANAGDDA